MKKSAPKWILAKVVFSAVLMALVFRLFVIGIYKVPTSSMLPNLLVGDVIFAWRLPFSIPGQLIYKGFTGDKAKLNRGDMIVFRHPKSDTFYVKRVVGLPGDEIKYSAQGLEINGQSPAYESKEMNIDFVGKEYYSMFVEDTADYKIKILRRNNVSSSPASENTVSVPLRSYFVIGDNRDSSDDSRDWGSVPEENIEGVVRRVLFSVDWQSDTEAGLRWSRLFLPIK
jgi:signal peptidase I